MQTDCKQRSVEIENHSVADPNKLPNKGNPTYQNNTKPNHQATIGSEGESADDTTGQAIPACSSSSVFFNPDMRHFTAKEYDASAVKVTRRKSHPSRQKGKHRHHSSSKTKPEVSRDAVDNVEKGVENAKHGGIDNAKQEDKKHGGVDDAKYNDIYNAKHEDKKHCLGGPGAVKMPKAMVKKAMGTMKNAAKGIEMHKPSLAGIGAKLKLMEKPKEESSIKTALSISTITDKFFSRIKPSASFNLLLNEFRMQHKAAYRSELENEMTLLVENSAKKSRLTERITVLERIPPKQQCVLCSSRLISQEAKRYSFLRKEKKRDVSEYENNFEEAPDSDIDLFTGIEENSSQPQLDLTKLEAFFSTDIKKNEPEHQKAHSASPLKSHSPSKGSSKPRMWLRKKASLRHFKSRKFDRQRSSPLRMSGEIDNGKEKGKQREKEKEKEKAKQGSSENKLVGLLRHARTKRRRVKSAECVVAGHQVNKSAYVMNHAHKHNLGVHDKRSPKTGSKQ